MGAAGIGGKRGEDEVDGFCIQFAVGEHVIGSIQRGEGCVPCGQVGAAVEHVSSVLQPGEFRLE